MVKTGKNFLNAKKAFEGKHDLSLDEAVNLVKNNASCLLYTSDAADD